MSASTSTNEEVRNCFMFFLPDDGGGEKSGSRDVQIMNLLSGRLGTQGFQVSGARPGKPRGAVSTIKFDGHNVTVWLVATRIGELVRCDVLTWSHKARWRRIYPQVIADELEQVCAALEKILRLDPKASSLARLTEDEFDELTIKAGY
jgi:hypothetical protein